MVSEQVYLYLSLWIKLYYFECERKREMGLKCSHLVIMP